ncbi:hypothetical protein HXX01_00240 [Candidatus Nomurabacteria bacterium]|nr:hypothetical protein [Candidatus Nomurabacteria bacterium]
MEQHADLVVVMRIFETLSNKLDDNNLKLSKFLSQTETISQNLQNAPVSSLISWHNSELIEIQSKKVWAFSYTLKWLDEKRVLDILKELSDKKDHEYHFILANTDVVARNEKVKSISDKISDFDRINNTNIAARFIVKPVTKGDFLFSIPNDIAIYQDFLEGDKTTSIVVINTEEFCNNNGVIHDKERNFDIRFSELRQVNRIIEWYKKYWSRVS